MDQDHMERIERMRRSRPRGVTDGFVSGLAGLGLSLLGGWVVVEDWSTNGEV